MAQNFPNKYSKQPTPTILVFGGLKLEASIAHPRPSICRGETDIDQEDCINVKLQQAQCLQRAREIGLGGSVIKLRDFEQKGGFQYVAKELLRHVSSQAQTHDERLHLFNNVISGFCQEFHSCKDQAVLDLTKDMARCKDTGRSTEESCSIVRCCSSVIVRCRAALIVLRAALIRTCTHYSLVDLANDAVAWASFDSAIQSEVNEASRSLHIDRVLLKYCGPGAREMFRVDNPRHGIRLLEHVINQVNYETSLPDILSLCEGFHHLCPHKAVRMLLENSLSEKDDDVCLELWQQLFRKDGALAEKVLVDMIAFAEEILEECSHGTISGYNCGKIDRSQERARNVTSRVGALIQCAMEHSVKISAGNHFVAACFLRESSIQYLHTVFLSLNRLQNDYSVFVSLNELFQVQTTVDKATQLIESIVVDKTNLTTTMLAEARRVVSLLTIISKADVVDVWVAAASRIAVSLVHENRDGNLLEFLSKVGLLTSADNEHSSQAIVSIAIALCSQSSSAGLDSSTRMKRCMTSVALVQDWSMLISHGKLLSEVVGFSSLLDVAYHSFTRCDEGAGESMESLRRSLQSLAWPILSTSSPTIHQLKGTFIVPMHKPTLHSSWYIGDGLLLPPEEALPTCVGLCTDLLRKCVSADRNTTDLYKLVSGRGAHSFALRVLCHASVVLACHGLQQDCDSRYPDLKLALAHTSRALAERCLGGTGSGITSSLIDSQKAVSFLLALPIKEAFALYKSSIPTAVKTNNFARLHTLSSVGMVSGSSDSKLGTCAIFSIGWKRQQKFYEQCAQLCARAKWWTVLKGHDIEFDSQRFYDRKEEKGTGGSFDDYAAYLLPMILAKMSQILSSFQVVRLTSLYTETFHLPRDLVIEQHISFLLSPSRSKLINGKIGCSFDSDRYEKSVRDSLQLLHPRLKRVATLKRCLDTLDEADISGQDYDMYSLVLRLYFDELVLAIDQGQGPINSFEADLEWIERRRDVLNILSAYFQGDRLGKRPCFAKFFLPLHDRRVLCGILGSFSDCVNEPMFDPLEPLQSVLATSHDVTLVTALSPLCIPLGLPQGYIHVRSLMARFRRAHENDIDYPSYENEVGPVMKRITSSNDRAQLANWCSNQYVDNDVEKLKCLEVALQSTIKASSEVERRRQVNPHDSDLEKKELAALDGLKLISLRKESLASILQVKHLLKSSVTSKSLSIKDFSDCLINELSRCAIETPELSPETLIDLLYYQGSLLASQRCLDKNGCLSINIFRQICEIVHAACSSVADQNSHIDIGAQARRMAHRWLFYGDVDGTANCNETKAVAEAAQQPSIVYDDDDTLDFVMDLIEVQESHEIALGPIETTREDCLPREQQVIAAEEGSAFRCESKRELSDCNDQRTSLRIAFVLAFARQHPSEPDEIYAKENFDKNKADSIDIVRKRRGVLTQLKLKRDSIQENNILNQSSTLLGIVFARLDSTSHTIARLRTASLDSSIEYKRKEIPKTITFAMRHRALQTAAILCPQESLEEVIRDEGYLQSTTGSLKNCSLRQCTFGVFVAKEIEEMGLPLPHSNLVQLSSMHFLSYARTLWRHHRDNHALCRSKGRLLLLLVEMSLQEQDTDVSFITNLIDAMIQFNLPRTLILSLERITEHQKRAGPTHWLDRQSTSKAITAVTSHMVLELQQLAAPTTTIDKSLASKVSSMLDRVINIAQDLLDNEEVRRQLEVLDVVVSNIRKSKTRFISDKLKSKLTDLIDNDTIPVN